MPKPKNRALAPYFVFFMFYLLFIIYAFSVDTPTQIFRGLLAIIKSKDLLITDYIELAGFGATLFNVGLVGIISVSIATGLKIKPNGAMIMALWLTSGFSFFGKNILNIWPVMLGVYAFSRYQGKPFANYALVCLLSTSLAPIVSQTAYLEVFTQNNDLLGILAGFWVGILTGFLLPPLASFTIRVHSGYNLYNVGFAAGLLGMLYASFVRALGVDIDSVLIWGTQFDREASIFIYAISFSLIGLGIFLNPAGWKDDQKRIVSHSGRLVTDYYLLYKESAYVNMGLLGASTCTVLLLMGANLNGPTLSGIFTIIGFGAFGKHIKNIAPVMLGAILSTYFNIFDNTSASNTLAILFSTCLAPISGQFGWKWGLAAGFLHVTLIPGMAGLHAGLNLYNNGFGAGFVALIMIPMITALRKDETNES